MLSKLRNIKWPGASKTESSAPQSNKQKSEGAAAEKPDTGTAAAAQATQLAALDNPSEKIRAAACNQIKDHERLLQVALNDSSDNIRLIAARQFAKHLPAGESARQTLTDFAASSDKKHLARLITAHHSDGGLRAFGLTHFNTDEDLCHIAIEARFHDTRQAVTSDIKSLEVVDKCWRAIKSKDKVVAREMKLRLDAHQAGLAQSQQQAQEVDKIIDEMDKLANGAWSPTYPNRYELFANRWQQLDFAIADDKKRRYDTLQETALKKVQSNLAEQQSHNAFNEVIAALETTTQSLLATNFSELSSVMPQVGASADTQKTKWQSLQSNATADKQQEQKYSTITKRLTTQLQQAKDVVAAVSELDDSNNVDSRKLSAQLKKLQTLKNSLSGTRPAYADELPQLIEKVQHTIETRNQQSRELTASINKQFGSLNSAINAKKWGPANSIHERLAKKVARLPAAQQKNHSDKLERLGIKLKELGDWKQFATEPKLVELCEHMEHVPSLGLSVKEQADRIRDLQLQWKAMGASPGQEAHWPRFKKAADTAYQPCAEYFARQRDVKQGKLKQRSTICDMLQTYLDQSDWNKPDLKLVEKTIRTAKNEWRDSRVFDRKATAALDTRFTELLARLDEKLQPLYEASIAEKQDLIDKAVALGEGEINQHCINQVKRLQGMWRLTGNTRRKDDQKLWTAFNDACSTIYQTHRGKQREQYAASVEHVTRAKAIIGELKAMTKTDAAPDEKHVQQLQDEFAALAEFPERDQKHLPRDLARALDALDNHRQKAAASAQSMELVRLAHNASLCDKLDELTGQPADEIKAPMEALLAEWNSGEKTDNTQWKKAMQQRLDAIVSHLQSGTEPDYEANTLARHILCIETEILMERETPASDKQLRMQYQLEKLQQGLSSASAATPQQQLLEQKMRWLTSGPAHKDQRMALQQRFDTASA